MGAAIGLLVWSGFYRHNCWSGVLVSDRCGGPVLHNQTCIMVKMSADPVAIMAGLLVWCKYKTCTLVRCSLNRRDRWSSVTVPSIPVSQVQF